MKIVKIGEARNHLSKYLRLVRAGGRVRILDRDTAVADLVPVIDAKADADDDRELDALARQGVLQRGQSGPIPDDLFQPGPRDPQGAVLRTLLEERKRR